MSATRSETPLQKYHRVKTELERRRAASNKRFDLQEDGLRRWLSQRQQECQRHIDDGGMFHGHCVLCGKELG